MGFLSDFFNKNISNNVEKLSSDSLQIDKTSKMMDEDQFWSLIDNSLIKTKSQIEQQNYLINELQKLSPLEIIGFRLRTDKLLYDTYNSRMWCAGYIMNGGCSDDSFEYFRCWIISRGKETYYKSKDNPDYLVREINDDLEFYDFESFWYVALDAFKKKTKKDLYDFIDYENFKTREGFYPDFEFDWSDENPESMEILCPNLYKRMWN